MNPGPQFCPVVDTASRIADNDLELPGPAPANLLEIVIPGYGAIYKFFLHAFGFDVTHIVFLGAIIWLGIHV
jgi:hypothetical protein